MTTWIWFLVFGILIGVGWYVTRKWKRVVKDWRDVSHGWKKLYRQEVRVSKRWRDLYKGRDVFMPFNVPVDGKLDGGHWEAVTVTTVDGDDAPTETITKEEKS